MVDHALQSGGWDDEVGGFFDEGYYFKGVDTLTIIRPTKTWWAQAEALNTLLLMADAYPDDPLDYFDKFQTLWTYTKTYLLDPEHGGWYDSGLDRAPQAKTRLKAQIWKGNYHTARTLMNCIDHLHAEAE